MKTNDCARALTVLRWQAAKIAASLSLFVSPAMADEEITIPSALLRIVESADIPAAVEGILEQVDVREGDIVDIGVLLGRLSDTEARIRADQTTVEAVIAEKTANNDLATRLAEKTFDLAVTELQRAHDVNRGFANSVSDRELNVLRLSRDKAELELQQAKINQEEAVLNHRLKASALELAKHEVAKHQIRSPIPGMVVSVNKRTGEWVSAGELVLRIVRVDRVRAEGFVPASQARTDLVGRAASIRVLTPDASAAYVQQAGQVVFVSPEADPVDGSVRVWVEFSNKGFSLRPGLRGEVTILAKKFDGDVAAADSSSPAGPE